jgi:hypothetical protein
MLPASAEAGWLGFRNETSGPVIVQATEIVNGIARQAKAHIVMPGEVCWDQIATPGNKLIRINDAKQPIRTLYLNAIQFVGKDLFFSIQTDVPPPASGGRPRTAPAKVKLVPAKGPPPPAPGRPGQSPRR